MLPLTLNFRSGTKLCAWANDVFAAQFPAQPTEHAPKFAPLDAQPEQTIKGEVRTFTYACEKAAEIPEREAARIAAFIRSAVDAGRRSYSDFLILTRKKTGRIAPYAAALEALNIPTEVSGAGAFGESNEVEAITRLLRALADPQDQLALVAVLRGPLFGVSDAELFAFKQAGGRFSIFSSDEGRSKEGRVDDAGGARLQSGNVVAEAGGHARSDERVGASIRALNRYFRWTRVLPASAALERILEDSGYLAVAATTPGGVDAGDVLHAVDRIRQVAETGGSLADAADALDADREASSEVESLPLEPGRTEVVRLMNLHKAKGLEANVVFLADPAGAVKPRVDLRIERQGLQARGWLKIVKKSDFTYAEPVIGKHADWPTHEANELPYVTAEEDRLLYVAATRSRELLVVSRWAKKPADGAWGKLAPYLTAAKELTVPADVVAAPTPALDCSGDIQLSAEHQRAAAHARVNTPSWSVTSATAEAHHIAGMMRAVEAATDDPSRVVVPNTPSHRADAGQAWGSLVHGLLEQAMRHERATAADLRRLGMWLTVEEPKLRAVLDLAVDTVLQVARAGFWAEARAAEHSVEVPFAFAETRDTVMNGVIDLMFQQAGEVCVIDYKTDVDAAARAASYALQLKTYERALEGVGAHPAMSAIQPVRVSNKQTADETLNA